MIFNTSKKNFALHLILCLPLYLKVKFLSGILESRGECAVDSVIIEIMKSESIDEWTTENYVHNFLFDVRDETSHHILLCWKRVYFLALQRDKKIDAIKLYRRLTAQGLKDSKDSIEEIQAVYFNDTKLIHSFMVNASVSQHIANEAIKEVLQGLRSV